MVNFEKVPLGEHNYYLRYTPKKKSKIWILLVLIFLIVQNTNAQDVNYNPNCTFYPQLKLYNYSMEIRGSEEFDSKLIQDTKGYIFFKIQMLGNWTNLSDNILSYISVYCDGVTLGDFGGQNHLVKPFYLPDGNISTEFSWNGSFLIPEKRFCSAVGQILGTNMTWQRTSGCSNCACRINELSSLSYETKRTNIISLQEFFLEKQLQEQQSQGFLNQQVKDLTIAIYVLTMLTTIINKDFRNFIKKNKTIIGFATFLFTGYYLFQNPASNISILLPKFSGIVLVIFSIIVLFNKYFLRFFDKILTFYLMILSIFYMFFGIMFTLQIFIFLFTNTNYLFSGIVIILFFIAFLVTYYLLVDIYFKKIRRKYRRATRRFESIIKKYFEP